MLLTHLKEHPVQLAVRKIIHQFLSVSFSILNMDNPLSLSCYILLFKHFLISF